MKHILAIALLIFSVQYGFAQKKSFLGKKINEKNAISAAEFKQKMAKADSMDVKFEAYVSSVCQKKGCWVNVDLGNNETMMVRFKDYGFFMPKDCSGQKAIFQGKAFKEVISVAQLRHYAEDAGKSKEEIEKITEPENRLSFEAEGVILFSSK
jgi:hypothetical protein